MMGSFKKGVLLNSSSDDNQEQPVLGDEGAASGHAPDVESDDDVDRMGEAVGIVYQSDEELNIAKKVSED